MSAIAVDSIVYLLDGRRALYVGAIGNQHAVRVGYTVEGSWDEPPYEEFDKVKMVDSVYQTAPVESFDAEIIKRRDELAQVNDAIKSAREEIQRVQQETKALIGKHKELDALRNVEDFLADRITHFVVIAAYGGGVTVLEKEAALKNQDRNYGDRKLLSLYGNRKDGGVNLSWHINRYSDGSGSTEQVICCTSHEEAVAEATRIISEMLSKIQPDRAWEYGRPIECMKAIGIPVPEPIQAAYDAMRIRQARDTLAKTEEKAALERAQLSALMLTAKCEVAA